MVDRLFHNRQWILRVMEALVRATEELNWVMEALDQPMELSNRRIKPSDGSIRLSERWNQVIQALACAMEVYNIKAGD